MQTGMTQDQTNIMSEARSLAHKAKTNPEFVQLMAEHGYDQASWGYFDELIATAAESAYIRAQAEATKLGGTDTLQQQRVGVWRLAQRLITICYVVFKGQTELLIRLGLHRSRRDGSDTSYRPKMTCDTPLETLIPWLRNLFAVAQTSPEIAAVLAKHGFPAAKLAECAAALEALAEAHHTREQATINRTEACLKRNGAFNALAKWLRCAQRTQEDIEREERRTMANGPVLG